MSGPEPNLGPSWTDRQCLVLAVAVGAMAVFLLVGQARTSADPHLAPPVLRIDPNTAPYEVIQALPRVGPTRARAWVQARANGSFHSLVDLDDRIAGIGPATCLAVDAYLQFDGEADPSERRAESRRPARSAVR
jgi:competence protein ComEA